jgi:hypothetical protein
MSDQNTPLLSKPTSMTSKQRALKCYLWAVYIVAGAAAVTCILVGERSTFASYLAGMWNGVAICLVLASWLLSPPDTGSSRVANGATRTTATHR